jgi:hypothetical protein
MRGDGSYVSHDSYIGGGQQSSLQRAGALEDLDDGLYYRRFVLLDLDVQRRAGKCVGYLT